MSLDIVGGKCSIDTLKSIYTNFGTQDFDNALLAAYNAIVAEEALLSDFHFDTSGFTQGLSLAVVPQHRLILGIPSLARADWVYPTAGHGVVVREDLRIGVVIGIYRGDLLVAARTHEGEYACDVMPEVSLIVDAQPIRTTDGVHRVNDNPSVSNVRAEVAWVSVEGLPPPSNLQQTIDRVQEFQSREFSDMIRSERALVPVVFLITTKSIKCHEFLSYSYDGRRGHGTRGAYWRRGQFPLATTEPFFAETPDEAVQQIFKAVQRVTGDQIRHSETVAHLD